MISTATSATAIRSVLKSLANIDIAQHSAGFFKTGKGEYGEGDRFHGIRVPVLRKQVKLFRNSSMRTVVSLLRSKWHEERLLAVLMLVDRYQRGDATERQTVFDAYIDNKRHVNNWDIVDSSAHQIVGGHLQTRSRKILTRLARSDSLWDRRIAVIATYHFIRNGEFDETLRIAEILLDDDEDLIHKAVGWMLREVGNRNRGVEEAFLQQHYRNMPRTMLRYAIEKLPERRRKAYLHGNV